METNTPRPSELHQLWAVAYIADDGSTAIYPFWFLPKTKRSKPNLTKALKMLGFSKEEIDSETAQGWGWIERLDTNGMSFPTLK